ncbi:MAG: hypothetical protein ACKVTZ_01555, partial [Bacteroidia bacterium]
PSASAKLHINATDRGLLIPNVALTSTNVAGPITAPATSLLVYNTATAGTSPNDVTPGYYYWDGTKWVRFQDNAGIDWHILGNEGTSPATNFVGTTDNQPLAFRTNNTEKMRLVNGNGDNGLLGVGVPSLPAATFTNIDPFATIMATGDGLTFGDIVTATAGNNTFSGYFLSTKARGTLTAPTLVQQGDLLSAFEAWGHDGASYLVGSGLYSIVEATPGANDMPTAMTFSTTPDGTANPLERMRITNAGNVGIGTSAPLGRLHIESTGIPNIVSRSSSTVGTWMSLGNSSAGGQWFGLISTGSANGEGAGKLLFSRNSAVTTTTSHFMVFDHANTNIGMGTNNPDASSRLDISSTTKGVLFPRVALTATNAAGPITLPATSLFVYNTATAGTAPNDVTPGYYYNSGTSAAPVWTRLGSGGSGWGLTGNSSTTAATNFIGTTDNVDFVTRTNNTEVMRATNAQKLLIGLTTPSAPSTQKVEILAGTGDALYAHSPNVGGWLGYETNFTVGTAGSIQGAGVWAANPAAGYTSFYAQSSGSATVAANINFSNVWMASYNLVDNSSASFNPSALYAQLNNTNATMGAGLFKNAIYAYSNRGTTAGNPGYTVGVNGLANSQFEDAIGVVGRAFCSSGFTIGGYFEGNTYPGINSAYAYVGGNDGTGATKIEGTGSVSEIIPTPNHGRVKLFCPEAPEYWYQDYGSVNLVNGFAHVELDPILAEIVVVNEENPIRVFATPVNMLYFEGVTITNQTATGFDLVELNGATHSGKVDYQLICKPKTNFGQGRFPQGRGPAWLKPDMEPATAKAANQPKNLFYWPADHIQYNYNPEEIVPVGEVVPAGPNAGKFKLGNGKFSDHLPMDKRELTPKSVQTNEK